MYSAGILFIVILYNIVEISTIPEIARMLLVNLEQVRKALDVAVGAIDGKLRTGQIEMAEAVANALIDQIGRAHV